MTSSSDDSSASKLSVYGDYHDAAPIDRLFETLPFSKAALGLVEQALYSPAVAFDETVESCN